MAQIPYELPPTEVNAPRGTLILLAAAVLFAFGKRAWSLALVGLYLLLRFQKRPT